MPGIQSGGGRESEAAHIFGIPIEAIGLWNEQGGVKGGTYRSGLTLRFLTTAVRACRLAAGALLRYKQRKVNNHVGGDASQPGLGR